MSGWLDPTAGAGGEPGAALCLAALTRAILVLCLFIIDGSSPRRLQAANSPEEAGPLCTVPARTGLHAGAL